MRPANNPKWTPRPRRAKPPHTTLRALESTGPDVKIRGTASHICRKYQHLAREAQMSGDRVKVENYLQHAEHYARLAAESAAANPAPRKAPARRPREHWDQPPPYESRGHRGEAPPSRTETFPVNGGDFGNRRFGGAADRHPNAPPEADSGSPHGRHLAGILPPGKARGPGSEDPF